jgi:NAD(P)-dependent dehydrogenase (short-subunit alcohol dehydrogenase family)
MEKELKAKRYNCQSFAADITKHNQVKTVVQGTLKAFDGQIDVLINVAGVMAQTKVEEISEKEWDLVFDVNCKGTFFFIKEVVPIMKKQKSGKIINFSSKSGKTGSALLSHYSAAKAAIIGFTQALAYEMADFGINVNCLCPGITEDTGVWDTASSGYIENLGLSRNEVIKKFTSKVPLKRLARIEDIVAVTYFMASKGADYMTGQAINVTGGREMH